MHDPPSGLLAGHTPALEQVVLRALARDPTDRYQTALELQEALERFMVSSGELVLPAQVGHGYRVARQDQLFEKTADSERRTGR